MVDGVGRDESRREVVHVSERHRHDRRGSSDGSSTGSLDVGSRKVEGQRKHSPGLSRMWTVLECGKAAVVPARGALESSSSCDFVCV